MAARIMTEPVNPAEEKLRAELADARLFAQSLAHELKSPLVTMQGYLAGLPASVKSGNWDQISGDVQRLQRNCRDLQATVDTLLALARREHKLTVAVEFSLVDVAHLAREWLSGLWETRPMEIEISADLPTISGDPILWRHVFLNLMENAWKACQNTAAPKLIIRSEQRDDQTVCVVEDNGSGREFRAHVFEIFASDWQHTTGTGIGLALVKRIVELQGGRIWVEDVQPGTRICWTVN